MEEWKGDECGSFYNYLSRGCEICSQGAGLVLFVTGECHRSCFYCPLSEERKGKDAVFADERRVWSLDEILDEGRKIGALGTGITGGEPLLRVDYVIECMKALKAEFGRAHHIHLYTGTIPDDETLQRLKDAGLDEIRFHPPISDWGETGKLQAVLQSAKALGLLAGVEIPAMGPAPGVVEAVRGAGAFLNLNELEFSEDNPSALRASGFEPHQMDCGAEGSEEAARRFMGEGIRLHYCPSIFKDAIQLRERLKRRAQRTARPFDMLTEDGTIIYGIISSGDISGDTPGDISSDLNRALSMLEEMGVPEEMYCVEGGAIEMAATILEEISKELKSIGLNISLVERYPLEDGPVVERIPL